MGDKSKNRLKKWINRFIGAANSFFKNKNSYLECSAFWWILGDGIYLKNILLLEYQ